METAVNYSEVYDFVFKLDKRLINLDKDANIVQERVQKIVQKEAESYADLHKELENQRQILAQLSKKIHDCTNRMVLLSKDLRDSIKAENLEQLNAKIDELEFGKYITQKELDTLL